MNNSVCLAQAQGAVRVQLGGGAGSSTEIGRGLDLEVRRKQEKKEKGVWGRAFQSIRHIVLSAKYSGPGTVVDARGTRVA